MSLPTSNEYCDQPPFKRGPIRAQFLSTCVIIEANLANGDDAEVCLDMVETRALHEWLGRLLGASETTGDDALCAARYRFLRQPDNAIVYAKHPDAWGVGGSGHVRYRSPEELDAAIDAVRGTVKTSPERQL